MNPSEALQRLIEEHRVYHCIECGKCTGACPMAQVDRDFSPRLIAMHAVEEGLDSPYIREKTWNCITCGLCEERCPLGIPFVQFIRALRPIYEYRGDRGHMSHGGALHALMRAQAAPKLSQNRLGWVTPDLDISSRGDILYFVGCLSYFETFFSDLGVQLQEIARATVKLLNRMGIEPVVLPNERCCGHDLFWSGDEASFNKLRRLNLESFQKAGVKTVVTACAECSHVLKDLYPGETQSYPFEVMHLSEYLQGAGFQPERRLNLTATYQDPCRLGRFQEVYEAPRALMRAILELHEMPHFGAGAWCCGNSAWLNCDRYSKQIQVERLSEAKGTRSDLLLTGCPKCQVHLACAMRDANLQRDLRMKVKDLSVVLAESIA